MGLYSYIFLKSNASSYIFYNLLIFAQNPLFGNHLFMQYVNFLNYFIVITFYLLYNIVVKVDNFAISRMRLKLSRDNINDKEVFL